jgi:hypothetical protein
MAQLQTSPGVLFIVQGDIRIEKLPWVAGKHRLTLSYACFIAGWAKMLPW